MLGLGTSATALPIKQWEPTDHPKLLMWLQAHRTLWISYGTQPAVSKWTARFPSDGSLSFDQSTVNNQPAYNAATGAVDFVTDASGSADDVLLDSNTEIVLDTSDEGWTIAMVVKCTDWDSANQVFFGERDSNNNFLRHNGTAGMGFKMNGDLRTFSFDTPSSLTDDTFYHIMLCADAAGEGVVTLYIDNVAQLDTETFTAAEDDFTLDEIGGKNNLSQTLTGSIKEIQVFDKELSSLEREECYNFMTNRMIDHSA
tara:strand:+ start:177 stop:944 length:768 start_codon:yes stop_codon:yes gene_type:complete